jgi:hypothetical protein
MWIADAHVEERSVSLCERLKKLTAFIERAFAIGER